MKLWGGRFSENTDASMDDFNASIRFDKRLYRHDILGSIAHATMLGEEGIIPKDDADKIVEGLNDILNSDEIDFRIDAEDIHMNIETLLTERIGEAGKKLHTGRSRNDQVALDTRMYVKDECAAIVNLFVKLCETLIGIAERNLDTIMPGYTHLQRAQPITLAHHMMAYVSMYMRDIARFEAARRAADVMPLGSGALAGSTFALNRKRVAELLGFTRVSGNSLDAVSDRDFALDAIYAASVAMSHMSRMAEELALWSSLEFQYVEISDAYSTGSSMMPQKKNPDAAELIRGKTGRVYGDLIGLLTVVKGLPLAYNKDMQEDKEPLFDALDTVKACASILGSMLVTVTFNTSNMRRAATAGFTNATDAADYLVNKGVAFRDAHRIVGEMVRLCVSRGIGIVDLSLGELKAICAAFDDDVFDFLSVDACVNRRVTQGGPAREAVLDSIAKARETLSISVLFSKLD